MCTMQPQLSVGKFKTLHLVEKLKLLDKPSSFPVIAFVLFKTIAMAFGLIVEVWGRVVANACDNQLSLFTSIISKSIWFLLQSTSFKAILTAELNPSRLSADFQLPWMSWTSDCYNYWKPGKFFIYHQLKYMLRITQYTQRLLRGLLKKLQEQREKYLIRRPMCPSGYVSLRC